MLKRGGSREKQNAKKGGSREKQNANLRQQCHNTKSVIFRRSFKGFEVL